MNFLTSFFRSLEALANGEINRGEGFGTAGRTEKRGAEQPGRPARGEREAGTPPRRPKA